MCVQRFDDSQCSAIHTTFRASLRSSSMQEPRDPLLKVLILGLIQTQSQLHKYDATGASKHDLLPRFLRVEGFKGHSLMIPPQVHLRRPCYDFYFL
jgi:hypothetical protein